MSAFKSIVTNDGTWWAITPGEVTDEAVLREMAESVGPADVGILITEVWHLHYQSRVKNCGDHGDACDMEGEWHSHWHAVKPGQDTAHTLARLEWYGRDS